MRLHNIITNENSTKRFVTGNAMLRAFGDPAGMLWRLITQFCHPITSYFAQSIYRLERLLTVKLESNEPKLAVVQASGGIIGEQNWQMSDRSQGGGRGLRDF